MALYNNASPKSHEAPRLHDVAELLSNTAQMIELSESENAAAALLKIRIGPIRDPLDGEEYTIDELKNQPFICQVAASDEEGSESLRSETVGGSPKTGGTAEIYMRRHARAAELSDTDGRQDVYLYFLDRVSAIAEQVYEQSSLLVEPVRVIRMTRLRGPLFASYAAEAGQGEYIWCAYECEWGDRDLGGG